MSKSPDAFRSIGEVSRLVGVAPHVLRYWEGQFTQLAPVKRADGRRYYRPDDIRLVAGLCQVLREEGLSIRGAKRLMTTDQGAGLREIGAARLNAMDSTELAPAPQPAVRLARPASPRPQTPAKVSKQGGRKPARRPSTPASDPLPLFPQIERVQPAEWLGRLVAITTRLRRAPRPAPENLSEYNALRQRLGGRD